jgi:hypothetical protein
MKKKDSVCYIRKTGYPENEDLSLTDKNTGVKLKVNLSSKLFPDLSLG